MSLTIITTTHRNLCWSECAHGCAWRIRKPRASVKTVKRSPSRLPTSTWMAPSAKVWSSGGCQKAG